jgi:hypothetical protein
MTIVTTMIMVSSCTKSQNLYLIPGINLHVIVNNADEANMYEPYDNNN